MYNLNVQPTYDLKYNYQPTLHARNLPGPIWFGVAISIFQTYILSCISI